MDSDTLYIAYSGSLAFFEPGQEQNNKLFGFRNYQINHPDMRSAYPLYLGLKELVSRYPSYREKIIFHAWGMVDFRNKTLAEKMGIGSMVKIDGYFSKADSLSLLANSDVLYLPLERGVNGYRPYALPGKMYEYLKAGKPVIALCEESECASILRRSGLGIISQPDKPVEIAEKLKFLIDHKDDLKQLFPLDEDYIFKNFDGKQLTAKLATIFHNL